MIVKWLYTLQELRANLTLGIHSFRSHVTEHRDGDLPQTLTPVQHPGQVLSRNMGLARRMEACFGNGVEGVQQSES